MTARPMSPEREAALDLLKELVGRAEDYTNRFCSVDDAALRLALATINDPAACKAAKALVDLKEHTIAIGSRTYTIRTVDDLRTYLEREVPEPGR